MKRLLLLLTIILISCQAHAATYYIDPNIGNDSNGGTKAAPWKTIIGKINTLVAGDTLFLRDGVYYEQLRTANEISVAGTADKPIRIIAYPGENPIIDGGSAYKAFRVTPNSLWTMYGTSTNTYVSVNTYSGMGDAYGYFGPENGDYALNAYDRLTDLECGTQTCHATNPIYVGPGAHFNSGDNKIYCRLEPSTIQTTYGYGDYPSSTNPNNVPMYLFGNNETVVFGDNSEYIDFEGIEVRYQLNAIEIEGGAHHINIRNCTVRGGRTPVYIASGANNILFENCKFIGKVPEWIAWTDIKSGTQPAANYQGATIDIQGSANNIEVAYCTFENIFDGVNPIDAAYNIRVHHNHFTGTRDDCMQMGTECHDIEVDHNTMIAVSKGVSWNESGNPLTGTGTVYIHHNIIDTSSMFLGGRATTNGGVGTGVITEYNTFDDRYAGIDNNGWVYARPFGDHSTGASTVAPWKVYNNTCKFGRDLAAKGSGLEYQFETLSGGAVIYHEVYNNIFWQTKDYRFWRDNEVDNTISRSIWDGNLYYCSATGTAYLSQRFESRDGGSGSGVTTDHQTLAAFKAHNDFTETQGYYSPGWENSGVEGDPGLDGQYYPTNNNARIGALDLSSKGWPGVDGGIYRGALKPK